jgi:hypothetical protein
MLLHRRLAALLALVAPHNVPSFVSAAWGFAGHQAIGLAPESLPAPTPFNAIQ